MQHLIRILFLIHCLLFINTANLLHAQNSTPSADSLNVSPSDSLSSLPKDSTKTKSTKKSSLDSKIAYHAQDSMTFNLAENKVFLYGNAEINYGSINLKAAYIEINFATKLVYASGITDSTNQETGLPEFKDGGESFKSREMTYNFETKKGIIHKIYSEEAGGYMHGEKVKKQADNTILVKKGAFTTCNLDHPHFAIEFNKAKMIPNDKIVTGPAYLTIEGIPTPLAVPFGFFPNSKGQQNGILIPGFGNSAKRGYALENGGYYFGISDYLDTEFRGDIYSRGSWGLRNLTRYKKRYKYNGNIQLKFARNIFGEKGSSDYSASKDFQIRWTHNQDPKANPKSRFNANVNAGSSSFDKNNSYNPNQYLRNQMQSSISYSTKLFNRFQFNSSLRHSQNNSSGRINMSLPDISLTSGRMYPFKKMLSGGKRNNAKDLVKNLSVSYSAYAKNEISTIDTLLFEQDMLANFRNGFKHVIPISTSSKLFKYITFSPSINYSERWYFSHIEKNWDKNYNILVTDTIKGFKSARDIDFRANFSTKLYGMLNFKKGPIKAFRHVITPSGGYTFHPDIFNRLGKYTPNVQTDSLNNRQDYNIFQNGIFGSPASYQTQVFNVQIANNLEMKVRSKKDTITGTKKIRLIDNFTIGSSFNAEADSLKWAKVYMRAQTKLFKSLSIKYNSLWDPYVYDTVTKKNINVYEYNRNRRLLRKAKADWNLSLNWNISSNKLNKNKKKKAAAENEADQQELDHIEQQPNAYVDFDNPWNLNLSYSLIHSKDYNNYKQNDENDIIQTLNFRGDVNLTKKWKIGFSSGYDFSNKDFSYTTIDIYRDLHCWELMFNWIPFGLRKSYFLTIRVKSSMLQDLKLTKRRDWRDL